MRFIADDGKIFDTMDECEEHEKMRSVGREIAQLWYNNVITYNSEGRQTEPDSEVNDTYNYLKEVYSIMSDCDESAFISIHCSYNEWMKIREYFDAEYGIEIPEKNGLWRYDNDNYEWINFEEEYKNFKDKWAPMGIF